MLQNELKLVNIYQGFTMVCSAQGIRASYWSISFLLLRPLLLSGLELLLALEVNLN